MQRKQFITSCGLALLANASISAFLQSCTGASYYAKTIQEGNKLILKKSEFISTAQNETKVRNFVLIKSDQYAFPIAVYRINDSLYSALLLECTHKSCELKPQGHTLICPCHGSEFSNTGMVLNPPAEDHLKSFTIKTDHETLYIYL